MQISEALLRKHLMKERTLTLVWLETHEQPFWRSSLKALCILIFSKNLVDRIWFLLKIWSHYSSLKEILFMTYFLVGVSDCFMLTVSVMEIRSVCFCVREHGWAWHTISENILSLLMWVRIYSVLYFNVWISLKEIHISAETHCKLLTLLCCDRCGPITIKTPASRLHHVQQQRHREGNFYPSYWLLSDLRNISHCGVFSSLLL